ncbi:MAG: hypothetical protein M3Q48_09995 [Actinomycetota bacterium]|nr:hypothetical protein [Actinomycetota bacterium]
MVVDTSALARELRRRRLGRPALVSSLAASSGTTWLPGELSQVPSSLLVLAAMSLAQAPR